MLGCKVMISSATITPALAEGYFNAYQAGWRLFAAAREAKPAIGCAWFDENDNRVAAFPLDAIETYRAEHQAFIAKRCTFLQNTKLNPPRRIGELIEVAKPEAGANDIETAYFSNIQAAVIRQHRRHASADPHNGKRVSFGVVRMANIPPCIALTRYLAHSTDWPADVDIRIMATTVSKCCCCDTARKSIWTKSSNALNRQRFTKTQRYVGMSTRAKPKI